MVIIMKWGRGLDQIMNELLFITIYHPVPDVIVNKPRINFKIEESKTLLLSLHDLR